MDSGSAIWIALAALVVGSLFSTLQLAVRRVTRSGLVEIAARARREKLSSRLEAILDDAEGHGAALALVRIVGNMIVAVGMVAWIWHVRASGEPAPGWLDLTLGIAFAAIAIWVFGTVIPLSVAEHAADRTVYVFSPVIRAVFIPIRPLLGMVGFLDEVVRRLAGVDREKDDERDAELLSIVERGEREGRYDETEADMIEAVVDFKSTTAEQIMTPRTEIEALALTNDLGEVTRFLRDCHHSRIPVYGEDLDDILGIFYVKDLLRWLATDGARGNGQAFDLKSVLRPALFVPESKTVRELLAELLAKRVHIAMVADEYGGTAGLVTMEDIVEEIFGEIQDEYEEPEEEGEAIVVNAQERFAEIDAREHIDDVNDKISLLGVELPESEEYDTVGGFVVTKLGRIPEAGEELVHDRVRVRVLAAEPMRVSRVRVEAIEVREGESGG